ncbi:MAG: lipo-like protein [Betaproteobacteria bacterium]|nr:lipo-like protein [Betaproteobacteria bacterium]
MNSVLRVFGRLLARYLDQPSRGYEPFATSDPARLRKTLRPGDVLLVEGNRRISVAIKYLTQSTWSHAALYIGDALSRGSSDPDPPVLIEVDLLHGVWAVPLGRYESFHTRICRPVGLSAEDRDRIVRAAVARLGQTYDLKNVIDLARYLLPTPPVPVRWRRRMIALGSGEPTRAICSTLIAQLFQSVGYPILPRVEVRPAPRPGCDDCVQEILHIRHHSLFAPRDFDISPYFEVVKPTLEAGFDYKTLVWGGAESVIGPKAATSA